MIEYKLEDHSTLVIYNSTVTTLGALFFERLKVEPNCQLSYYDHEVLAKPGDLKLVMKHKVVCVKKDSAVEPCQSNVGMFLPFDIWSGSPLVKVLWVVRWTQKGLMPVRPAE